MGIKRNYSALLTLCRGPEIRHYFLGMIIGKLSHQQFEMYNNNNINFKTFEQIVNINIIRSTKCAAITGVGVDMSPHCFIKCPNGSASYKPLAAKSKLYLLAVGLFALTEIDERRITGA